MEEKLHFLWLQNHKKKNKKILVFIGNPCKKENSEPGVANNKLEFLMMNILQTFIPIFQVKIFHSF